MCVCMRVYAHMLWGNCSWMPGEATCESLSVYWMLLQKFLLIWKLCHGPWSKGDSSISKAVYFSCSFVWDSVDCVDISIFRNIPETIYSVLYFTCVRGFLWLLFCGMFSPYMFQYLSINATLVVVIKWTDNTRFWSFGVTRFKCLEWFVILNVQYGWLKVEEAVVVFVSWFLYLNLQSQHCITIDFHI